MSMAGTSGDAQILKNDADEEDDDDDEDDDSSEENPGEEDWDAKVISEINTFLVSPSDVKPLLKSTNRVAKLLFSLPRKERTLENNDAAKSPSAATVEMEVDEDGDLIVPRRGTENNADLSLFIEYENSTSLEQVGLQVWRGALLLADFIIHSAQTFFQNKTILEFGSGTGLSSVVASIYAKKVIATDLADNESSILRLIETNVTHNKELVLSEFLVKALDFKNLSWSQDLESCIGDADVLLAADVVYHEKITEAFVRTLQKCLATGKPKNVFIAIEKRYVFSVSDLDVVAPMYEQFLEQLQSVLGIHLCSFSAEAGTASSLPVVTTTTQENSQNSTFMEAGAAVPQFRPAGSKTLATSKPRLTIQPVHLDFPQYFNYERTKELVLWHIRSEICP